MPEIDDIGSAGDIPSPTSGLDPLYASWQNVQKDFNTNYQFSNAGEGSNYGWSPRSDTSKGAEFAGDQSQIPVSFDGWDFRNGSGSSSSPNFDYTSRAPQYGYDTIDPVQVMQVAKANFGSDPMAALRYRYGDDASFVQDERFNDNPGRSGYFAKPTDASRLGGGGVDESKYPLWNLGDSTPGLFQGALGGDWPLTTVAGMALSGGASLPGFAVGKISGDPLAGSLTNLATGGFGGGGNVGEGDWLGSYEDMTPAGGFGGAGQNFISDADPGGIINPATGKVGPGMPGGADYPGLDLNGASGPQMKYDPATGQFVSAPSIGGTPETGGGNPATGLQMSQAPVQQSPFMPGAPTGTPVGGSSPGAPEGVPDPAKPPDPTKPGIGQRAVDAVMKNPLGVAGLGLNAYRAYQAKQQGQSAQDQLNKNAQPAADASKQLISEGTSGTVPPAILQQFNTSAQQAKDAIRSRYANMGRDPNNDSAAAAELAKVDQDRDAQIANYASTLLNQGLTAAGVANGPQTAAVQAGVNQDKDLSNSMSSALQNYMMLQALQGRQTGQGTPP